MSDIDNDCYKCRDWQQLGLSSKCPYCGEAEIKELDDAALQAINNQSKD